MAEDSLSGTWVGRLLDVRGYEGTVRLELKEDDGAIVGVVEASIGETHQAMVRRAPIEGSRDGDAIVLKAQIEREPLVTVVIEGRVSDLAQGGKALQGMYQVAARGYSPLREGVIVASTGRAVEVAEVGTPRTELLRSSAMPEGA